MKLNKSLLIILVTSMLSYPVLGGQVDTVIESKTLSVQDQGQEQLSNAFIPIHDEEVAFMKKYGEPVHVGVIKDNVKITVEYMITDAYTARLLISVAKVDGIPLKSTENLNLKNVDLISKQDHDIRTQIAALPKDAPYIEVLKVMAQYNDKLKEFIKKDNTVDMEGLNAYFQSAATTEGIGVGTSSASYGMYHTQENTKDTIYFTYRLTTCDPLTNNMHLSIDQVNSEMETTKIIGTDLVEYLYKHQDDKLTTQPNPIEPYELERLEELKKINSEHYLMRKEDLESRPKVLLAKGNLNLELISGDTSCVIDNMGFIDGKLHIRMSGPGLENTQLEVYDQTGEEVYATYHTGSTNTLEDGTKEKEAYRIFEIPSVEALKSYTFKVKHRGIVEQWTGPWEISLDILKNQEMRVIPVNKIIPYSIDEQALLKEIKIDKTSLVLVLDQIKSTSNNEELKIKVKFNDGSEVIEEYSSASGRTGEQLTLVYLLKDLVMKDISAIQIADQLIQIQ